MAPRTMPPPMTQPGFWNSHWTIGTIGSGSGESTTTESMKRPVSVSWVCAAEACSQSAPGLRVAPRPMKPCMGAFGLGGSARADRMRSSGPPESPVDVVHYRADLGREGRTQAVGNLQRGEAGTEKVRAQARVVHPLGTVPMIVATLRDQLH